MEIRQLKYFQEVYRTGSISLAAENLSVTQPALSQQIALLERELKTRLFERSKRGMKPTAAAQIFADKTAGILENLNDLENSLKPRQSLPKVSFAVGETLAAHFVPGLVSVLRQKFPGTRFRVIESNLTEIRAALRADEVDFALSPEALAETTFINRYLIDDEILPAVAIHHALSQRSADWDELREHEWILFHPGSAIRKISDAIFAETEKKFSPRVGMELRSVAGVVRCLEEGLGVGFISNLSLTAKLTALRLPQLARRRRFFLTHKRKNAELAPILDAILQFAGTHKEAR
jgi:DNA-binding transcriptional LysR family regulator